MEFIRKNPLPSGILAGVVIAFALFNLFRADKPPEFVQKGLSNFMQQQAQQAVLLSSVLDKSFTVVVMDVDRERLGFRKNEIKEVITKLEESGAQIIHFETLAADESRGWDLEKAGFPYLEFIRIAGEFPDADAIISLCGIPYFGDLSSLPDPKKLPKLLTTSGVTNDENAEDLFWDGRVFATTVFRFGEEDDLNPQGYELLVAQP